MVHPWKVPAAACTRQLHDPTLLWAPASSAAGQPSLAPQHGVQKQTSKHHRLPPLALQTSLASPLWVCPSKAAPQTLPSPGRAIVAMTPQWWAGRRRSPWH